MTQGGAEESLIKSTTNVESESDSKRQQLFLMDEFKFRDVHLQESQNQMRHKTSGLSSSTLVLRRGQPFTILINNDGQPFDPLKQKLVFQISLGPMSEEVPVSVSGQPSSSQWSAILEPNAPRTLSISLFSPASSSVGVYTLHLRVETRNSVKTHLLGQFTLLCNPWCQDDAVFLESEELRKEYIRNDFGLLFKGSVGNMELRPWSFDQYEKGILDICMKMLQLSPQSQADARKDLLNRSSPVYISRVISAMVNCNDDDKGVLMGNWTKDFRDGVKPWMWSGSADILRKWSETQFRPVKYGQCWVFAAVMCTVMRALGIPTRVVTTFDSAHDTNANMVIEEYYSERGEKLPIGHDKIWNFHVWVESWMKRPDLHGDYDGWQVLDPTPQERSEGMFRCGPASVKAIYEQNVNMPYDVPFVYAEVNADVHIITMRNGKQLTTRIDKERVGSLICTKLPGPSMLMQDITKEYKTERVRGGECVTERVGPQGIAVSLQLLKDYLFGKNLSFNVIITNKGAIPKLLRKHVNAQNKEYHRNPTETFWEAHDDLTIGPNEIVTVQHEISFSKYMTAYGVEDNLVNLAVVIEDVESQEIVLASEEFNICSPTLDIEIQNEHSVIMNTEQVALLTFTNPFKDAVSGELTVSGSVLLEEKFKKSLTIQPQETIRIHVHFIPRMKGAKMLQANLVLMDLSTVLRGFKTIIVQA